MSHAKIHPDAVDSHMVPVTDPCAQISNLVHKLHKQTAVYNNRVNKTVCTILILQKSPVISDDDIIVIIDYYYKGYIIEFIFENSNNTECLVLGEIM